MCKKKNTKSGFALVLILVALVLLMLVAAFGLRRSTVSTRLAGIRNLHAMAAETAETGANVTAAKIAALYRNGGEKFPDEQFDTDADMSNDRYTVWIINNGRNCDPDRPLAGGLDPSNDCKKDGDGIFRVISTGTVGESKQTVDVLFKVNPGTKPPSLPSSVPPAAMPLCGNKFDIAGAENVDGTDYNLPAYGSTGANANGTPTANLGIGVAYNIFVTANVHGSPTGAPGVVAGAGLDCASWGKLAAAAGDIAQTHIIPKRGDDVRVGSKPGDIGDAAIGTVDAPKIVLIECTEPDQKVKFTGNFWGAGILIIRGCEVEFTGTVTYAGITMVLNGGGITFSGTEQIFGSMFAMNDNSVPRGRVVPGIRFPGRGGPRIYPPGDPGVLIIDNDTEDHGPTNVVFKGNAKVKFSTEAFALAQKALTNAGSGASVPSVSTVAWRTSSTPLNPK